MVEQEYTPDSKSVAARRESSNLSTRTIKFIIKLAGMYDLNLVRFINVLDWRSGSATVLQTVGHWFESSIQYIDKYIVN